VAYPAAERVADFQFTQGDELQGLLHPDADPTRAVIRAALHPAAMPAKGADIEMRWVIVRGDVDAGTGPATQRSGPAFIAARERLGVASTRRERVAAVAGEPPRTSSSRASRRCSASCSPT
jgi:hypothetical protein